MKIQSKCKLLMIGDSITDCGRARPIADSVDALGNGYVSLINACLNAASPRSRIHIINMGVGGNTVRDLAARWSSDVIDLHPDWLSIMIGINDVWRQFDTQLQMGERISLDEYARTLETLIRTTRSQLSGLVLMTPYFIEPDRTDPMRVMMDQYGSVVRELAERYQAILVDTQAAFDRVLIDLPSRLLAEDRVHPNLIGHMILARAFLKEMDYSW